MPSTFCKKFFVCFILLSFVVMPYASRAMLLAPIFNIKIIVNTVSGDGIFPFHVNGSYPDTFSQNFQIQTQNGTGTFSLSPGSSNGELFALSLSNPSGWQNMNNVCTSSNPNVLSSTTADPATWFITGYPYNSITCTFTEQQGTVKTPILIIPGVFGTDIKKGDDLLWANPKMARGFDGFMDPLGFNPDLSPIDTSLTLGDVIRQKPFFHYSDFLINDLAGQGYTEGKDLFTFPYDWRFGVSESVVNQLKGQIDYILNQTDAGKAAGKVDVVAHSTGGLIVKKYVMEHPTDHHIGKAIFVGVPNLGSPLALKALIEGDQFGILNLDADEMKKIGQNMPVVYDLAPTQEYYNQVGSFLFTHDFNFNPALDSNLNYADAMQNLIKRSYANGLAVTNSANLHTADFDNFDLRTAGVNLYSLVGCKSGTLGQIKEVMYDPTPNKFIFGDATESFDFNKITSGDGTVPFGSADSLPVDQSKTFFVPEVGHSALLSADGSRQQIVNLLTGSSVKHRR